MDKGYGEEEKNNKAHNRLVFDGGNAGLQKEKSEIRKTQKCAQKKGISYIKGCYNKKEDDRAQQ